jgi:hypothetical protein
MWHALSFALHKKGLMILLVAYDFGTQLVTTPSSSASIQVLSDCFLETIGMQGVLAD